jgi:CheY-like chemotaxis protein
MPGIDGVELYERILEFNPNLRAIMVTAYAGDDGVQRAVDAGTWRVLRKPVDIKKLLHTIVEAIS